MIGLKGIAKRAVFVIDKDGIVRHSEVLADARNEPDLRQGVWGAEAAGVIPVSRSRPDRSGVYLNI